MHSDSPLLSIAERARHQGGYLDLNEVGDMNTKQRRLVGVTRGRLAVVGALALVLAGCAGSPETGEEGDVTSLTVAYTATGVSTLPLFIGLDRGYFEEEGLDITAESFGTAPYPQAVAGEVDVVAGDHAAAIQGTLGGLELVFLGETSRLIPGIHQFVTPADSEYQTVDDLRGARIGVSNLVGSAKFALDAMLDEAGLTEADVQISQIALDALGPALELGNIDVAHLPGSYLDAAKQASDLTVIADFTDLDGLDGLAQAGFYVVQSAYDRAPDVYERFYRAYERAAQDALDDTDLLTEYFIEYSKTDPAIAERMALPSQVVDSDPDRLQALADKMFETGLIPTEVTVGEGNLRVADFYR